MKVIIYKVNNNEQKNKNIYTFRFKNFLYNKYILKKKKLN